MTRGRGAGIEHGLAGLADWGQEALTNAAKHAQASLVEVALKYQAGKLVLMVKDDGVGFEVKQNPLFASSAPGAGLSGLMEHFQLLGGQVEVDSSPGRGTMLVAWCQVNEVLPSNTT